MPGFGNGTMTLDLRAQYARRLVRETIYKELQAGGHGTLSTFPGISPLNLPPDPSTDVDTEKRKRSASDKNLPPMNICIVGAGICGLYIAMLLESLNIPGLTFEILESANTVGGRIKTHYFNDVDYVDIGAMRFAETTSLERTFSLFKKLNVELATYFKDSINTPTLFNDVLKKDGVFDPFNFSVKNNGNVPDEVIKLGADNILGMVVAPYIQSLTADFDQGYNELLAVGPLSSREYLRTRTSYGNYFTIQWMETTSSASGLFDQAFQESVFDALDVMGNVPWKRVQGGTFEVIKKMLAAIKVKPQTAKRVTRISRASGNFSGHGIEVQVSGEAAPRIYSKVFCTASLPCMQRMDLHGLELHPSLKDGLRSLRYDAACKVAIRFRTPWWVTKCNITRGGSAATDLPIRSVVYPSEELEPNSPAVLIVSYTWGQDAQRMGSLIAKENKDELQELMLQNLARLHAPFVDNAYLKSQVLEMHAFDWYNDPNTSGAFTMFGPAQFENLYPYLTRPAAGGDFFIAGEAASAHHAWVAGSLDSGARAVHSFLKTYQLQPDYQDAAGRYIEFFDRVWGRPNEVDGDESGTEHLQVMLGMDA